MVILGEPSGRQSFDQWTHHLCICTHHVSRHLSCINTRCLTNISFFTHRFQNIVPISLYISIEFVRTCQAAFIYFDSHMVHNGIATLARSWNLSDDLGQIEYIFSDKTGTLTQVSSMIYICP